MGDVLAWHPHPDVWFTVGFLVFGYAYAIRRIGPNAVDPGESVVRRRQVVFWYLGVAALWIVSDYPFHDIAEGSLFSFHMVEHLVIALVVAPLLLLGTPAWLARLLVEDTPWEGFVRAITRPVPAFLMFNVIFVGLHWPVIVEGMVTNPLAHFAVHLAMFLSALIMWVPILSPIPDVLPTLTRPMQMLYLMGHSILPIVPASFLTFGETAIYPVYETFARPFGWTAVEDQTMAGLIMKIGAGFLLWAIIATIWFRWWEEQRSEELEERRRWEELEAELRS
jgi:putative membrane protein